MHETFFVVLAHGTPIPVFTGMSLSELQAEGRSLRMLCCTSVREAAGGFLELTPAEGNPPRPQEAPTRTIYLHPQTILCMARTQAQAQQAAGFALSS